MKINIWQVLLFGGFIITSLLGAFTYLIANHSHDQYVTDREFKPLSKSVEQIENVLINTDGMGSKKGN